MGLSDDQRAMLRLLAQRGEEGYDDVAALMGLSVEEVRAKVAKALAELAEEGALAPEQPQAAPESSAQPEPEPAPEPPAVPAPEPAPKTTPAAEPKPSPGPKATRPRKASTPPRISLPSGNGPRAAIAAAAVVLVAIVFVLIVSGGNSDSGTTSAAGTTSGESSTASQTTPTSDNSEVTKAVLKPVGGSGGSGVAIFGRVKNSLVLQIAVKGLVPTTKDTQYAICIAASPNRILPIASTAVGSDGTISASVKVPVGLLLYLANETYSEIVITLANSARLTAEIKRQAKEPTYTGTPVLRGEITGSIVGNKDLLKEAREFEEAEKGE